MSIPLVVQKKGRTGPFLGVSYTLSDANDFLMPRGLAVILRHDSYGRDEVYFSVGFSTLFTVSKRTLINQNSVAGCATDQGIHICLLDSS